MQWIFRENSLDAIRLLAATQVVVLHASEFMFEEKTHNLFFDILRLFPGVPIFFFVSGYLISKSFERAPRLSEYSKSRMLRLYPALIICVAVNIIMVWSTGYLETTSASATDLGLLFLAKSTFLQFYNPEFMRAFGDGVLNGSLWTICVEVQFYVIVPFMYAVFGKNRQIRNRTVIILIVIFLVANRLLIIFEEEYSNETIWKLYRVSFAPWIYMFLFGVIFQRNFIMLSRFVSKIPLSVMLASYLIVSYMLSFYAGLKTDNHISPILFLILAFLIFRMCYFMPARVNGLMRGNDISYGIYIWHMPIVNQMLYFNLSDNFWHLFFAIGVSVVIAILSWKLIEKPALHLKKSTLNTRLE